MRYCKLSSDFDECRGKTRPGGTVLESQWFTLSYRKHLNGGSEGDVVLPCQTVAPPSLLPPFISCLQLIMAWPVDASTATVDGDRGGEGERVREFQRSHLKALGEAPPRSGGEPSGARPELRALPAG